MTEEETTEIKQAPGMILAYAPQEAEETGGRRRRRSAQSDAINNLRNWTPRTRLGNMVYAGLITTYEEALASGLPIREVEIVDALLPELEDEIINVNMVQRMTDSGRRVRFNVMACVGNRNGYVGLAMAKAKEVSNAIQKAIVSCKTQPDQRTTWKRFMGIFCWSRHICANQGQRSFRFDSCHLDASC